MGLLEIVVVAVGLSMDAFAVSITLGLSINRPGAMQYLIPGIYFGFFQALMPLIGFFTGTLFAYRIQQYEHWVAFTLLGLIGGKMIKDSFSQDKEQAAGNPFHPAKMLLLAVATSIDALVVGITFSFFEVNIAAAIMIIGLTTFCISAAGVKIGSVFGRRYRSKAEFAGGAVLVLLGTKILIEHLL